MSRDVTIVLSVTDNFSSTLGQFKNDVAGIAENTGDLGVATDKVDNSFSQMTDSITAGIVAFAGWKGLQAVGEMIDLGKSVNVTATGFNALTAGIGGSSAVMAQLREATQGATADVDLMSEANKLLSLNLVNNAKDLAHVMGVADDLSDVFGVDAKSGVDAFTKALETGRANSLVRFGLDLDAIKARAEELSKTMNDKDAFRMAVLEQADKTLARFGGAADAAATPIDRLKVSYQNLINTVSQNVNIGANGILGIIEMSGTQDAKRAQQAQVNSDAAADFARQNFGAMEQYLEMADVSKASDAFVSKLMYTTANALKNDPNADVGKLIADQVAQGWAHGEHVGPADVQGYVDSFNATFDVANSLIVADQENKQNALKKQLYANLLAGDSGREFEKAPDILAQQYQALLGLPDGRQADEAAQREANMLSKSYHDAVANISGDMLDSFAGNMGYDASATDTSLFSGKLDPSYMASLVPKYMQQSGADQVTGDLRDAQNELAKLQDMADQHLISDDNLSSAKNMVDNLSAMADQAQRSADAFKNLTEAQALGQGGGGMQGEISDQVLAQMQAAGASKEAISAMQTQLDLASGKETESSQEMKNVIVPMIAKMSASHAAVAVANLDQYLKDATLQGLSQEQISAALPGVLDSMNGKGGTSKGDADTFAFTGGYDGGKSPSGSKTGKELPMTEMARSMTAIHKDSDPVAKNMAGISDHSILAQVAIGKFKDIMEKIPAHKKIEFEFTANDPQGLVALVKQLTGGSLTLANTVKDNGGSVPGATHAGNGGV